MTNYSVLMSVYKKEKPEYLKESMDSMFAQTVHNDDFVLVCDGPLTTGLNAVIEEQQGLHGDVLNVVRLEENVGLGKALNKGMNYCKNELVARMDSDDVARPERCERELKVFAEHPELSIVSGTVEEFSTDIAHVDNIRVLPENTEEIRKFAKGRNPFNHPCVMYKKSAVEAAGGYQDFYLLEDYYLWLRMLLNGNEGYNIQEPLLWMRAGSDMYKRRAGAKYAKSQRKLFEYMKKAGFITGKQCAKSCVIRTASSVAPNWLREFMFKKVLRG